MSPAADNIKKGIVYILLSTIAAAIMNALIKVVASGYPAVEIAFSRQFFALVPITILIFCNGGWAVLKTSRLSGHLLRGTIGNISLACLVFAYKFLPLSDVVSYNFTMPLFLTALSVPLLGEKVGIHRWLAVLAGFGGMLIIMHPGHHLSLGAVLAITSAFLGAGAMITVRHLSRTEHPLAIVFYFTVLGAIFTGALSAIDFVVPNRHDAILLISIGLVGGVVQYSLTLAYRYAQPTAIAPYNYLALIWALGLQYLIWGTLPTAATIAGAAIIIASGLYIIYREVHLKRRLASVAQLVVD
jgi:drug/metabolite transporter (DMT)-like permease